MPSLFHIYRDAVVNQVEPTHAHLLIEGDGALSCHYAPFEHINHTAHVVLLGITPGAQQAGNALNALRDALGDGHDDASALAIAKATASFSGQMRNNLVALLDRVGLHRRLGITTSGALFSDRSDLVHFTSSIRHPVFVDGKDYSGSPSILSTPFLKRLMERWLVEEAVALSDAYWLPLGTEPTAVAQWLVEQGHLRADRVMAGLPHPSPSNMERIAYFLGKKPRALLSSRTNAEVLDANRERLTAQLCGQRPWDGGVLPPARVDLPRAMPADKPTRRPKAGAAVVAQAEAMIAARFSRIADPADKMAGFTTPSGRHLAIERDLLSLTIWTEDVPAPANLGAPERYEPRRGRHSNLKSQAPRIHVGKPALKWRLADTGALEKLLGWYCQA